MNVDKMGGGPSSFRARHRTRAAGLTFGMDMALRDEPVLRAFDAAGQELHPPVIPLLWVRDLRRIRRLEKSALAERARNAARTRPAMGPPWRTLICSRRRTGSTA
jgi:hypothetical protein